MTCRKAEEDCLSIVGAGVRVPLPICCVGAVVSPAEVFDVAVGVPADVSVEPLLVAVAL